MRYLLPKKNKLRSQKLIDGLYAQKNKATLVFPLLFRFQIISSTETKEPIQFIPVAPKKRFAHAVQRNQIKRHIRESFRLNLHQIEKKPLHSVLISISYVGESPSQWDKIQKAMLKGIQQINSQINEKTDSINQ
jgi:ribonuclease P protein component